MSGHTSGFPPGKGRARFDEKSLVKMVVGDLRRPGGPGREACATWTRRGFGVSGAAGAGCLLPVLI
jgi:hypothetical protein